MNEILSYFFHPEMSLELLLDNNDKKKWQGGILKWVLGAILCGLLTILTYKINSISLGDLSTTYYASFINNLLNSNVNEGFIWLALAGFSTIEILIKVVIKTSLWILLLYMIGKILRDHIKLGQIVKLSVFAMLTWIVSQVAGSIAIIIVMNSPFDTFNQMLTGLAWILSYWNLILFIIGYSILTNSTFFKSGVIVIIIQGSFWMIADYSPLLQMIFG